MKNRLLFLFLGAGMSFFIGLGAGCSGSPVRVSVTTPEGIWAFEINLPEMAEGKTIDTTGDILPIG